MSIQRLTILTAFVTSIGCTPPPEAPADLENLSEYIFAHMADEDTEALEAGLLNLKTWLETGTNLADTYEGYMVNDLKDDSVNGLDEQERSIRESLYGAAVAHSYTESMDDLVEAMFVDDWSKVSDGTYDCYERIYNEASQPACLLDGSCEFANYTTTSVSSWAGVVDVISVNHGDVRRLELEDGTVVLQRTWLDAPAETSGLLGDQVELHAQYLVNILFPASNGGILRTSATWMDVKLGDFDDLDFAKNQMVSTMQKQNDIVSEWIAGPQDAEGACLCSDFDYDAKECPQ